MASFCTRTGSLVTLSNNCRTAQRNHPAQEFNNGVVLTAEPLNDNQLFEVKIDKKINSWSGSIEIGVTTSDPLTLSFPTSATGFRDGTWIMSGSSVLKDGHTALEEYGQDLDQLSEGDRIGILRTSQGSLHFYVNGIDQGQAASNIPARVYAVVDMYGKCAQVSVVDDVNRETLLQNEFTNEMIQEASFAASGDRLIFHEKTGSLVRLTNGRRTAERRRPLDEFNNGVVMTNRPIKDDEMFEIRIERLVDKWSGSIEVGITTHDPTSLDFPATMTNMRSGTIMMSGCGILTNGKGTRREYGNFNLDELSHADRIGLMRKSNGALHYYINGQDQGVAATRTPSPAWGVVDLYGMAVKVTIVDANDPDYNEPRRSVNLAQRDNEMIRQIPDYSDYFEEEEAVVEEVERLLFHPRCGNHAAVIMAGQTAHRPNAIDDFNCGVVLTNRPLKPNEFFDVRLDKLVDKWAGSIEIGVTTHSPTDLDFPSTMTNIRSGTWMMTGNGVMHNGTTVLDEYGQNLDRVKTGDRVGVVRRPDGKLHFYVNGVDQGEAATNVPATVFGVIDLYGQAAQATIIDHTDDVNIPGSQQPSSITCTLNIVGEELRFYHRTGRNASISSDGKSATRPNARGEFNDAIVMSNRPLRDNELFEVTIDKMVDRWSGSIEAGMTLIHPSDLDYPSTMTDIDYDTWMLSGSAIMQDGTTIKNGYKLDLDTLQVGSRIGMVRCSDSTLHFYLDGQDMGVACTNVPTGVYAVIDLYGQCAQVRLTSSSQFVEQPDISSLNIAQDLELSGVTLPIGTSALQVTHWLSDCCGKNITLQDNGNTAQRGSGFNHGLVFSAAPLKPDEIFEVKICRHCSQWSGGISIGLTTLPINQNTPWSILPPSALEFRTKVTWLVTGSQVRKCQQVISENYVASLERLEVGDRVGVKRGRDGTMHVYINGEDQGVAATGIPKSVSAVVDVFGSVDQVQVTSSAAVELCNQAASLSRPPSIHSLESMHSKEEEDHDEDTAEACYLEFQGNHGKNIQLSNGSLTATRTASYNNGLVVTDRPLRRNHLFKVRIDRLNSRWTSSLMIGVLEINPEKFTFPVSADAMKRGGCIIQGDCVLEAGVKVKDSYGPDLDTVQSGSSVGILVDDDNCLHLYVDDVDKGVAATDIPATCYGLVDVYGQCEQVTLLTADSAQSSQQPEYREKANMEEGVKEKFQRQHQPENKSPKNCDYMNLCNRFKSSLGLPEGYFDGSYNCCFCDTCHKVRGESSYHRKGDPPRDVAVPVGWCKFGLKLSPKAEGLNVFKKWHMAYHGTVPSVLRRVLDTGDLIVPDESSLGSLGLQARRSSHQEEKNKPEEDESSQQIALSPTLRYAGCQKFAPASVFSDPKTKKQFRSRVAFQVCVKPGSYKISGQSVGINEQIDPKFSNNEVEWATKEKGAINLCAMLVKLE